MDLPSLLASFASAFAQENRLLRMRFGSDAGIGEETLLPARFSGHEEVSGCYRYELDCLSADGFIELKTLLGQPIEVSILQAEGSFEVRCGVVTEARDLGTDGGFAKYGLVIEPALATLRYRRNSRVFQDKTVPEIVAIILDEHLGANSVFARSFSYELDLTQDYPQRSYCNQYRESDLAFIERLLFEEGIAYSFRFGEGEQQGETSEDDATPHHTLICFDEPMNLQAQAQERVRFHRADGTEAEDSIVGWGSARQLQSGSTHLNAFDYKRVALHQGADATTIDQGEAGSGLAATLEDYDPQTLYYAGGPDEGARYAALRQSAKDSASKTFKGESATRGLIAGRWFELADHPVHDQDDSEQRQFVVTGMDFEAHNNLPRELLSPKLAAQHSHSESPPAPYSNRFSAVRRGVPLTPQYSHSSHARPTARGSTTATVVGPAGEEIYTDEYGRIKVQFHWQRTPDHPEGNANRDEKSSCWIRVAYPSAGANWGTQYIPRIGQEVLIGFIEEDIDRPIVTGVLYNGGQMPPTYSGAGNLPANKTLSGTKTKEYKGSRYNELLFDDSTNETRAKLSSEHAKTQLNQGYLIHPRTEGKGEARGEGFELRTDEAGALRAAHGLLLSTDARQGAQGKQLDRQEALAQLEAAENLAIALGDSATHQLANKTETGKDNTLVKEDSQAGTKKDTGHQHHLRQALQSWDKNTNHDKDGKSGVKEQPGKQPAILMSAPAGIAITTPNSATFATGTNFDQVANRDTNQTTGRRWIHNAGESISLFVEGVADRVKNTASKISLKLIAAKGKVQMQAQDGELEATAQQNFTITSVNGKVIIQAPNEVLLTAGGGYIRIGSTIEIHNPGLQSQKAGNFSLTGGTSMSVEAQKKPQGSFGLDQEFVLLQHNGNPVKNRPFQIKFDDGGVINGHSDEEGCTGLKQSAVTGNYRLVILPPGSKV